MSNSRIIYLFTRTPLHVGAGASVGAIDQPVQRERHTGFPIIPGSSLKGSFADEWNVNLFEQAGKKHLRVTTKKETDDKEVLDQQSEAAWLFGSDHANHAAAGSLLFGEARLLAFPIRSAKGSFAWITSPLILRRAARDGVFAETLLSGLTEPNDAKAIFDSGTTTKLAINNQVVLEEYVFESAPWMGLPRLGTALAALIDDPLWKQEIDPRLVIVSDGMMSYFAKNACEIAQHVRISDETGTAETGGLFNQENVPSETLFYSLLGATDSRLKGGSWDGKKADEALSAFETKIKSSPVYQFGGDASTGLGYCSVKVQSPPPTPAAPAPKPPAVQKPR